MVFPTARLAKRSGPPPHDIRERAETPTSAPRLAAGERVVVGLAAGTHYITGLGSDRDLGSWGLETVAVEFAAAETLRRLPLPGGGTRSLYGPDGLVADSERAERWLLWPMGIASAGAMRQWGTQATAFVGRRHFDDPYLFDQAFRRVRR